MHCVFGVSGTGPCADDELVLILKLALLAAPELLQPKSAGRLLTVIIFIKGEAEKCA